MVRLKFAIDLRYEIADNPADFVFNIHAARTPHQSVFAESLSVSQPVPSAHHSDALGSRYLRMTAFPGPLAVRYDATVDITHHLEPPARIVEVPIGRLPPEV